MKVEKHGRVYEGRALPSNMRFSMALGILADSRAHPTPYPGAVENGTDVRFQG